MVCYSLIFGSLEIFPCCSHLVFTEEELSNCKKIIQNLLNTYFAVHNLID